ncbi:MAG: hypothetical protein BWX70_03115 [Verrucomicrobia bacterium ADurb.Bin070]|nr:MAG: hypothetical protein BWX70_03115 [Verrucomicrobia bacterium ADurb.Bin070]
MARRLFSTSVPASRVKSVTVPVLVMTVRPSEPIVNVLLPALPICNWPSEAIWMSPSQQAVLLEADHKPARSPPPPVTVSDSSVTVTPLAITRRL